MNEVISTLVSGSRCWQCLGRSERDLAVVSMLLDYAGGGDEPPIPPEPPGPSAESLAEANLWADRVVSGGGVRPSSTNITYIAVLFDDLKAANIYTKFDTLNVYAPDNLTAARTPQIQGVGSSVWANTNFVDADLTTRGLKGNGSSKWLDTGVLRASVTHTDMSLMAMCDESPVYTGGVDIGWMENGTIRAYEVCLSGTTNEQFADISYDSGNGRTYAQGVTTGYHCVSRSAANLQKSFFANRWNPHGPGTTITTTPISGTGALAFSAHARMRSDGTLQEYTSRRIQAIGIMKSFTEAESLALYTALKKLRESFVGGSVTYGQDWALRVVDNGGVAPSAPTIAAVDVFLDTLDAAGILTKMYSINAMISGGIATTITPIFRKKGRDPWLNDGPFLNADSTVNGLQGRASSILQTGIYFARDIDGGQDTSFVAYLPTALAGGNVIASEPTLAYQFAFVDATSFVWDSPFASFVGRIFPSGALVTPGYFHLRRSSASLSDAFVANSIKAHQNIGTNTNAVAAIPVSNPYEIPVMGRVDKATSYPNLCSFASISKALTDGESLTLYNAIQTLRTSLGGGYV